MVPIILFSQQKRGVNKSSLPLLFYTGTFFKYLYPVNFLIIKIIYQVGAYCILMPSVVGGVDIKTHV